MTFRKGSLKTERNDTIAAVATARGTGGVAVIRISGENALETAKSVFRFAKKEEDITPRYLYFGTVVFEENVIDSGLFAYFKAPASYTGEDVVEISCHGGVLVTETVLSAVIAAGARLALPGEFTKRAFINGKLLLDEAEAVSEIIEADSERALLAASANLLSGTGKTVSAEKEMLKEALARFFAVIDWPDEEIDEYDKETMLYKLFTAEKKFSELIRNARNGITLKDGVKTVIAGAPNAGKSTLMNALADCERSIVTSVPGTTRDIISETVTLGGVKLNLSDTAGIRESDDEIEKIGIERAVSALSEAELIIFTVDATSGITPEVKELSKVILKEKKPTVTVFTKCDLSPVSNEAAKEMARLLGTEEELAVSVSAKNKEGISALENAVVTLLGLDRIKKNEPMILSRRQYGCLLAANRAVSAAIELIKEDEAADIVVSELENAVSALSELDGTKASDEILATIFSKFCVGK